MRLMDSLGTALQPYNERGQGWDGMVENKEKVANKRKEIFPLYWFAGQTLLAFAPGNTEVT